MPTPGDTFTPSPTGSGILLPETADQRHRARVKEHIQAALSLLDELIGESDTVSMNEELQVAIFTAIAANLE